MKNNSSNVIHETIIRDIVDVLTDLKDSDEVDFLKNKREGRSYKSIAKASSKLVLVFPVIMDKNLSISSASIITKAVERKGVSMLQMLFSAINIDSVENGMEFISKYHTNLNLGHMDVDDFIDAMDKFVAKNESALLDPQLYAKVKDDMRNLNYFLPENINESSLSEYQVVPATMYGKETVQRVKINTLNEDNFSEKVAQNTLTTKDYSNVLSGIKTGNELIKNQLLPNDVKKANELAPTMMVVNFISKKDGITVPASVVIGVKAKMYPVDTQDIINRISLKAKDNNSLLRFIKATTREISFFKDFLFAIDKAKIDALSQSNKGSSSKLWKVLERRALKSKIRRRLGHINDAAAITTLVVSNETVEMLKKEHNIDISKESQITPIMEAYNFMSVVIVDESMETAQFLYDTGNDMYETLSFDSLEREQSDKSYKKIVNLMTKMGR